MKPSLCVMMFVTRQTFLQQPDGKGGEKKGQSWMVVANGAEARGRGLPHRRLLLWFPTLRKAVALDQTWLDT